VSDPTDGDTTLVGTDAYAGALLPGDLFADKYLIERTLGVGGMGVVYGARNTLVDRPVALKFMLPEALSSTGAVARFLREARAVVQLQSEHVARVLDVDTLPNGRPYIVMECLDGENLAQLLRHRGRLPIHEACGYVVQAIDAIAEAHARGIVHRDLKPSNLFLTQRPDGSPLIKVLDFGISKEIANDDLTATATTMGSPAYMSPEQIREAKRVDARSDVWSLGVILYELIAGTPPYTSETALGVIAKILENPAVSLSRHVPQVPGALDAIVARCLARDRDQRFASVAQLAAALAPFVPARERGIADRALALLGATVIDEPVLDEPPPPEPPVDEPQPAPPPRRRWLARGATLIAAALVGLVAGLALWLPRDRVAAFASAHVPRQDPRVAHYLQCWDAFDRGRDAEFAACYALDGARDVVDNVPAQSAAGRPAIVAGVARERAAFPDLQIQPQLVVASGRTIAAILYITGTSAATGKKLGMYAGEVVTMDDASAITHERIYIDQPTIYHQLGLIENDTSPGPLHAMVPEPETLTSPGDAQRNKAIVEANLTAVNNKDADAIEPAAADDIQFFYHGEKDHQIGKRAYVAWWKATLASADRIHAEPQGLWAAGDTVAVATEFTGVYTNEDRKQDTIQTHVLHFFRIANGKITQQHMFVNRMKTEEELGLIDVPQLARALPVVTLQKNDQQSH
jgi:eukaryotic-like serine/threonine-protein kinase